MTHFDITIDNLRAIDRRTEGVAHVAEIVAMRKGNGTVPDHNYAVAYIVGQKDEYSINTVGTRPFDEPVSTDNFLRLVRLVIKLLVEDYPG